MELNTPTKEFNLLNMSTYMINYIVPERLDGNQDGEKKLLSPSKAFDTLTHFDIVLNEQYSKFMVKYDEFKTEYDKIMNGDTRIDDSNTDTNNDGNPQNKSKQPNVKMKIKMKMNVKIR